MPDDTQTPAVPVANPEPEAPPPPAGPTMEEIQAAQLQQERQRAEQIARENEMLRQQVQAAWTQRPPTQQPADDPAKSIFETAITEPDKAAANFRNYIANATAQAAAEAEQRTMQRIGPMIENQRVQATIQSALDRYPHLTTADKMPDFVGEVARQKAIYEARGVPQSPSVYINKAAEAMQARVSRPASPMAPAHVEGSGAGSFAGSNPAAPPPSVPQQNPLEKAYGMPAGTIVDQPVGEEVVGEVRKFVESENALREKHQVMPSYSEIVVRQ